MIDLSDTPAGAISRLDDALRRRGQDVQLRKTNTSVGELTVRAHVRGYRPEQLIGDIKQSDLKIILSPTSLDSFGLPEQGWFVVVDGPRRIVAEPAKLRIGNTVVRIELQVRGID